MKTTNTNPTQGNEIHLSDESEGLIDLVGQLATIKVRRDLISDSEGQEVYEFIKKYVDLNDSHTIVQYSTSSFNVESLREPVIKSYINLAKANNIPHINDFLYAVNFRLPDNGVFIGKVETKESRKKRILAKYPFPINLIYYFFDFLFKRVFPKFSLTRKIYNFVTAGRNRVISKTEAFGRLYAYGFKIVDEATIKNNLYFVAQKVKSAKKDTRSSEGAIFRMKRTGKNGKSIYVYKMRTMYVYSEYLQEYVYERNSLQEGGKFKDDFRITTLGKIFRKYWLDEVPMVLNLLKGDLKIVGVRPLSMHYQSLYPEELRMRRQKVKPGLIPPFYADMPKTLEEIVASEMKYLDAYEKHPFLTDTRYFFAAFTNIVFKKARSK